jgi:hypothetical protein
VIALKFDSSPCDASALATSIAIGATAAMQMIR